MFSLVYGKKIIFFILVLTAPLSIALFIHNYGLNVPFWDQWELVPLLEKARSGELGFTDVWAQHNEHRIFFPKLLMLSLAYVTNWNITYELYANLVLGGLTLLFLYSLLHQIYGDYTPSWFVVVLSFLIFSPAQWENWIWGWQIQIFLSVLATVVAIWSVNRWPGRLKAVLVAIGAAGIASYSFVNGLLTWIVVGLFLLIQRERKWRYIVLWAAAFVITAVFFFHGYRMFADHTSLSVFLKCPYDSIRYMFAYVGSPLSFGKKDISIAIGILFFLVQCLGTVYIKRSSDEEFNRLLPWLALASYTILSAGLTCIGRLKDDFGVGQALSSRYATISTLFVISGLVVAMIWTNNYLSTNKELPAKWIVVLSSISTLLILCYILSYFNGKTALGNRRAHIERACVCLENVDVATEECLEMLHPNATIVREYTKILLKMGLIRRVE